MNFGTPCAPAVLPPLSAPGSPHIRTKSVIDLLPSPETLRRVRRWWPSGEEPEGTSVPTLTFEESAFVTQSEEGIHFHYQHLEDAE